MGKKTNKSFKTCDLDAVFAEQRAFVKARDWEQFHTLKNVAIALNVEASELLELFMWMRDEEAAKVGKNIKLKREIEREVADVFYWLCRLSDLLDIDLEAAFFKKMKENAKKYPVKLAKGNWTKYTKL